MEWFMGVRSAESAVAPSNEASEAVLHHVAMHGGAFGVAGLPDVGKSTKCRRMLLTLHEACRVKDKEFLKRGERPAILARLHWWSEPHIL